MILPVPSATEDSAKRIVVDLREALQAPGHAITLFGPSGSRVRVPRVAALASLPHYQQIRDATPPSPRGGLVFIGRMTTQNAPTGPSLSPKLQNASL